MKSRYSANGQRAEIEGESGVGLWAGNGGEDIGSERVSPLPGESWCAVALEVRCTARNSAGTGRGCSDRQQTELDVRRVALSV